MTDRYVKNVESVRKISKTFGLKLLSFDPNWCFADDNRQPKSNLEAISSSLLSNYHVPDDFIGKVAILMGLPWEFDTSNEHLEGLLREYTKSLNNIGKNRPKFPECPEAKEIIADIRRMTNNLDRQAKEQIQETIGNINHVLKIRNGLVDYSKDTCRSTHICTNCAGSGCIGNDNKPCHVCDGSGEV